MTPFLHERGASAQDISSRIGVGVVAMTTGNAFEDRLLDVSPALAAPDADDCLLVHAVVGGNGGGASGVRPDGANIRFGQDGIAVPLAARVHAVSRAVDHVVGSSAPREVFGIDAGPVVANASSVAGVKARAGVVAPAGDYQRHPVGLPLALLPSDGSITLRVSGERPVHAALRRVRHDGAKEGKRGADGRGCSGHVREITPNTLRIQAPRHANPTAQRLGLVSGRVELEAIAPVHQPLASSRRTSSASTASRMNLARPYVPHSASIRSSTSAGRRTCVALLPSGGRPMRDDVVDTDMSGKLIKNDTDIVDRKNDVVYINGIDNGGNP